MKFSLSAGLCICCCSHCDFLVHRFRYKFGTCRMNCFFRDSPEILRLLVNVIKNLRFWRSCQIWEQILQVAFSSFSLVFVFLFLLFWLVRLFGGTFHTCPLGKVYSIHTLVGLMYCHCLWLFKKYRVLGSIPTPPESESTSEHNFQVIWAHIQIWDTLF